MKDSKEKAPEVILEPYSTKINDIRNKMTFQYFENDKPYSFDHHLKSEFDIIIEDLNNALNQNKLTLSPMISNKIPIFLPQETRRIAFFSYKSKSVREVKTEDLKAILTKQAEKQSRMDEISPDTVSTLVHEDLKTFEKYHATHNFDAYRRDIDTTAIQFNAYDEKDNLLVEKSFAKGGLVFDMDQKDFSKIEISYPRRRKQRSDKKDDYIPLKLIKIRGINLPNKQ